MIIENKIIHYLLLIIISFNLINCSTMEPEFKVLGEVAVLQDIKINLEIIRQAKYPNNESTIVTLYNKGKKYNPEIEKATAYNIYFSYKEQSVGILKFENVMQWANDYINHLYVSKENDAIYMQYIGRKSEIDKKKGFKSMPAIPLKDFYIKNNIVTDEKKEDQKEKFFKFYNTSPIRYTKIK